MKELGLRNEEELQAYFTEKAVEYLKSLNKTTICWNESANSGKLESSVILQFWSDGKDNENVIREVKNGRKIIVSKFNPYYLDYPYPMHSLKAAYEFEPVFHGIEGYEQNVLGVESPLWTEWIDNTDLLAFRVFPRLTAVSESAWCDKSKKDYLAFENSLKNVNKLIENTTGIKAAPLKDCNVKNPLKRAAIMMKFGMHLIDFEMIARSNRAAKEMKKCEASAKRRITENDYQKIQTLQKLRKVYGNKQRHGESSRYRRYRTAHHFLRRERHEHHARRHRQAHE